MVRLEDIHPKTKINGLVHGHPVEIIEAYFMGPDALSVVFREESGEAKSRILLRQHENTLTLVGNAEKTRSLSADGNHFRLASEAYRIRLAHLFDPLLAVHTSIVQPLPHQITAVYEEMLPRQPLKFLLADDPGAGKTIMVGLLMKELMMRGDLKRCLVCCPGGLVEQWQEEMRSKFNLRFQPVSRDLIENDMGGNPFQTYDLSIGRLDQLSRSPDVLAKLKQADDWDLIVCDEAHKMSCPWYGGEAKPTKRYELGMTLSKKTRHLLLMTATPHNGKDEDFQSFLRILDPDRFEGKPRSGETVDASDLMRRMVKEDILKFDGTRLFPERRAETPTYDLTPEEFDLYTKVTNYVSNEMGRAERLIRAGEGKRGMVVGFAMTTLQRRLASSPEAIYQSLKRRKQNLERDLTKIREGKKKIGDLSEDVKDGPIDEDSDDDDYNDVEREDYEQKATSHVTAAQTIQELESEIATLSELENDALKIRTSSNHAKWHKLRDVLENQKELFDDAGHRNKLIIFTEHRDTLNYLVSNIRSHLGVSEAVVEIHGLMSRDKRHYNQEKFVQDKDTLILVATDAAGEGINLQRAHLLINYDIPWNPNRLEQRFGRIHRIGQTEVCYMWNLVAKDTREGDVWKTLFDKLEKERVALGDRVFDVLGRAIEAKELRDLMVEAIRYGNLPEVRKRLSETVEKKLDTKHLGELLEEEALATDVMDWSRIVHIKEEMERAEARKLQPHFIRTFFINAFEQLGGNVHQRETGRYEITYVPSMIRQKWESMAKGPKLLTKYERVTFDKDLIQIPEKPTAEYICPGHPLLDITIQLILEKFGTTLNEGSILVDNNDQGDRPRTLWYVQADIVDERRDSSSKERVVSRQMHFVEVDDEGNFSNAGYAPYLDYRPIENDEKGRLGPNFIESVYHPESESEVLSYAVNKVLLPHFLEVRQQREAFVDKTKAAVKERLTKEIAYWDNRANELKDQELQGKMTRLSSGNARRNADDLEARLKARMAELEMERMVNLKPPLVVGCAIVVPKGLLVKEGVLEGPPEISQDRGEVERLAMEAVIANEISLGRQPRDVHLENRGYDIESYDPKNNCHLFIEVKGRVLGATTVTVSRNEILTGLNKADKYILAIVQVDGHALPPKYIIQPFINEPDFTVTSSNYDIQRLFKSPQDAPGVD